MAPRSRFAPSSRRTAPKSAASLNACPKKIAHFSRRTCSMASRSTAPGSRTERSFPGTVVPPPAPTRRDRRATAAAAATSRRSGTAIPPNLALRGFTCGFSNLIYHTCHAPEAAVPVPGRRADRPEEAGGVPGGNPQALHRRPDRRRAAGVRRASRTIADDARVRLRPGDDGASANGDRALRFMERGEARGRSGPAAVRDARRAPRTAARPRGRAGPGADCARHRRAQGTHAVEVAVLAHVRLALDRASPGRLRHSEGGGAARAGRRAGRGDGGAAGPAA